ncbi:hypothetical protein GQR58_029609 [Nymphon striatum]|nr:hypothetical protein GQR58_029609 [Nymphon striatum]
MNDETRAALLLGSALGAPADAPLGPRAFWKLHELSGGLPGLLGMAAADIQALTGIPQEQAERIARLLDRTTAMAIELERYETGGLSVVTGLDPDYPQQVGAQLGTSTPPVFFTAGEMALWQAGGVAIMGEGDPNDQDSTGVRAELARAAATEVGSRFCPVFSGGGTRLDRLIMNAATDAGGSVIAIVAGAMDHMLTSSKARGLIAEGRLLIVSAMTPPTPVSEPAALGRAKCLYASADATLIVACDAGAGEVWTGANEALEQGWGQVVVWQGPGEGAGNAGLLENPEAFEVTSMEEIAEFADIAAVGAPMDLEEEMPPEPAG